MMFDVLLTYDYNVNGEIVEGKIYVLEDKNKAEQIIKENNISYSVLLVNQTVEDVLAIKNGYNVYDEIVNQELLA